jgi:hypothetical protein
VKCLFTGRANFSNWVGKNTPEEKSAHKEKNKVKLRSLEKKSAQLGDLKTINKGDV